jgi:alanine racemase
MLNTCIEINLKNLKRNFLNIRKKAGNRKILAVVKADAYGHGMIPCVKALLEQKKTSPDYFGVATLKEGIELRKGTLTNVPILCFAPFNIDELPLYMKNDIIPSISDELQAAKLLRYNLKKKLKIHINIDTGMGLTGIQYYKAVSFIRELSKKKLIIINGIFTIFATADKKEKTFAFKQLEIFKKTIETLKKENISYGYAHAANSAAILNLPEAYFDMVRTGSSLFGFYPSKESEHSYKVFPVMSLYSRISVIKEIKKGESVGFGRSFISRKDTKIATVPIGYADGFKRNFSNCFYAVIKGKFYPQIGNVSMDRIAFDVGNDKILTGEKVVLIGKEKNAEITLWDWADRINSIPYEITCTIGQRVPRVYKN